MGEIKVKGVITKNDYKHELESNRVPEIFPRHEIDALFAVVEEDKHLIFSAQYEAGLRKREWMHLEGANLGHAIDLSLGPSYSPANEPPHMDDNVCWMLRRLGMRSH